MGLEYFYWVIFNLIWCDLMFLGRYWSTVSSARQLYPIAHVVCMQAVYSHLFLLKPAMSQSPSKSRFKKKRKHIHKHFNLHHF